MQERRPAVAVMRPYGNHASFQLVAVQVMCLSAAALIAVGALLAAILEVSVHGVTAEWVGMTLDPLIASVGCGASLAFRIARPTKGHATASRVLACAAVIPALLDLLYRLRVNGFHLALMRSNISAVHAGEMPPVAAIAFLLLAAVLSVIRTPKGFLSYLADGIMFLLGLLVLAMVSSWVFTFAHIFGTSLVDRTPPAALCILILLIVAAFSVRAQHGIFDILVDGGVGGRIARILTPIVITIPFFREAVRARVVSLHLFPEHSEAAVLAAITAMLSLALLIMISRHVRRMEEQIQGLSLRDELTGLYNLRGFRLLAEQALRLANRSQAPFSVLFVDVDRLKQINDSLGHAAGSALLVETAELLTTSFRESDVIARIGGDEFAVAGQFSAPEIRLAAQRLEDQALATRVQATGGKPLSISVGFATGGDYRRVSLQDLLDEADTNMYNHKGRKSPASHLKAAGAKS
jgi:diguanylate cyclase (GGDEF)-like protein